MRRPLYRSEGISRNGSQPRAARRYPPMHRYRRLRQFVFCEARTISYVLLCRCGLSCNSAALSSLTWRYSALLLFGAQESAGADVDLKAGDRVYTTGNTAERCRTENIDDVKCVLHEINLRASPQAL